MLPEISPERIDAAIEEARDASQYQNYKYPWTELSAKLRDKGHDHFWLLGYGSLNSQVSSARTIDVSEHSCRLPAIAFGARRQFSYRIPQALLAERYGVTDGTRYSALDCKVTYDRGDALNGILTRVFIGRYRSLPSTRVRIRLKAHSRIRVGSP